MRRLLVPMFCAALSACASTPAYYSKPGSTPEDLAEAVAGCRAKSAFLPAVGNSDAGGLQALGNGLTTYANREQFMQDCLRAQGWIQQK